jgi:arylsulfatase A-like enzyme
LLIKFPHGVFGGKKIHFPVQHADLYATLMDLLGLSYRGVRTDGVSFKSWLPDHRSDARPIVLQSTRRNRNAIVSGDFKLIQNDDESELYHLSRDPFERVDIAGTDPIRAGYLRQLLLKELGSVSKRQMKTEPAELDDAARENLKALGYLD